VKRRSSVWCARYCLGLRMYEKEKRRRNKRKND
jgi:hypothetical protein